MRYYGTLFKSSLLLVEINPAPQFLEHPEESYCRLVELLQMLTITIKACKGTFKFNIVTLFTSNNSKWALSSLMTK